MVLEWERDPMPDQTYFEYTQEDSKMKRKWIRFDLENPRVYELLIKYAFQLIERGHKHYGIGAVFERIRWHTEIETTDSDFKLNNNYRAFYTRKFNADFPDYDGFFRTRIQKGENHE